MLPLWVVHITEKPLGDAKGRADGFVCFGCFEAGDLSQCPELDQMRAVIERAYPDKTKKARWAEDAHRLLFQVEEGDLMVHPIDGEPDVMIGVFEGGYARLENDRALIDEDSAQTRRVRWLATVPRSTFTKAAQRSFGSQFTIHSSAGYRDEVLTVLAAKGIEV
jgi:predicted Mrr-cat superfamily restriction endonuclease